MLSQAEQRMNGKLAKTYRYLFVGRRKKGGFSKNIMWWLHKRIRRITLNFGSWLYLLNWPNEEATQHNNIKLTTSVCHSLIAHVCRPMFIWAYIQRYARGKKKWVALIPGHTHTQPINRANYCLNGHYSFFSVIHLLCWAYLVISMSYSNPLRLVFPPVQS